MKEPHGAILLKDIELLIGAHDRLIAAKERINAIDPKQFEQIKVSSIFAAWLFFKGC